MVELIRGAPRYLVGREEIENPRILAIFLLSDDRSVEETNLGLVMVYSSS